MGDLPGFVKALCCLLIEPHRTRDAQRQTHVHARTHTPHTQMHTQTHAHAHSPSSQGRPFSSTPGGNDDSHYRLRARLATVPLSAVLLS